MPSLAWSGGTAVAVFALINAPALLTPAVFLHGLNTEIAHARLEPHHRLARLVFAFPVSLDDEPVAGTRPGAGDGRSRRSTSGRRSSWRSSAPAIRLVLVFAVLWYFMHELSPMKPFMAIERHMTVMSGLFAVLAVDLVARLCRQAPAIWRPALATGAVGILAAPAAISTLAIARSAPHDTRAMVERVRAALDGRDAVDWYATFPAYGHYPPLSAIDGATDYVVLVQETAERFAQSASFAGQSDRVRAYARGYSELLARPAILVESTARQLFLPQRAAAHRRAAQRCRTARRHSRQARSAAGHTPHAVAGRGVGRRDNVSGQVQSPRYFHSRTSTKCPAIAAAAAMAGDTRWVRPL